MQSLAETAAKLLLTGSSHHKKVQVFAPKTQLNLPATHYLHQSQFIWSSCASTELSVPILDINQPKRRGLYSHFSRLHGQTWLGCMYSSRYVLQSRLSQSSVMCPPYMISPNRYLRSSHGTFIIIITIIMKITANAIIPFNMFIMLFCTLTTHPTCVLASR